MLDRAILWAREHRCPWLRLATSSENPASNRIAERVGLQLNRTFISVDASPRSGPRAGARVASPMEFESIRALLAQTADGDPEPAVYTEGWTAYVLTPERLRMLLAMESVVVSGEDPEAIAIATTVVSRPSIRIGLLRGERVGMERICRWLVARAVESGVAIVRANVADQENAVSALRAAGFGSRHGHSLCLYEIDLRESTSAE